MDPTTTPVSTPPRARKPLHPAAPSAVCRPRRSPRPRPRRPPRTTVARADPGPTTAARATRTALTTTAARATTTRATTRAAAAEKPNRVTTAADRAPTTSRQRPLTITAG